MEIKQTLNLNASAETVYNALATEKGIQGWWCKDSDVSEEVGGTCELRFIKDGNLVPMSFRVDELMPNSKVVWTCTSNPNVAWINTVLEYNIKQNGDVTTVEFTHKNWDEQWKGQEPFTMTAEGWNHFMQSLTDYCQGKQGAAW